MQNVSINIAQSHLTGVYFDISVLIRYALIAKTVRIFECVNVGIMRILFCFLV